MVDRATIDDGLDAKIRHDCAMCKNAGTVWAPSWAFPRGFKIFCGGSLTRHEDGVHVEIVCPSCEGESAAREQSQGGGKI